MSAAGAMERSPASQSSSSTNPRLAMYKKGTPPWRELHKQRLRERLRQGRHQFLSRLRNLDGGGAGQAPVSNQDWMLAEWERLESEIVADETERLIEETGGTDWELGGEWTADPQVAPLVCPLCQACPARLSGEAPAGRLSCRCGLDVFTPSCDPERVRTLLLAAVAAHEAACPEAEVFFTQSFGQLSALCGECGHQGPLW